MTAKRALELERTRRERRIGLFERTQHGPAEARRSPTLWESGRSGANRLSSGALSVLGNVQDIDLKLLRVFRAIASHGGFVAAQTELNVSLSTISNQIKQLEERLGVRLCERGNLGFRLTKEGVAVLDSCEDLFGALDAFKDNLSGLATKPVGEIRLGVVDNLVTDPSCRVPAAIGRLNQEAPGVALKFVIAPPSDLESQVISGVLDIAISLFPAVPPALDAVCLFHEHHGLYCGQGHTLFNRPDGQISAPDLKTSAYVSWSYQETHVTSAHKSDFNVQGATPFMEGLLYLALSGRYITYLPKHAAERWVRAGQLRELLPRETSRAVEVLMISRRSLRTKPVVALFKRMLEEEHAPDRPESARCRYA
jgi:DNA-binding transcriptional LysR family regulator